ncbi:hypothetical protein D0T51_03030 [Parabacteroides sp. 52]|uniref:tetratricopeptide repeat protein n=1 Tax=unclassified Parabacteroides TaxID=2649774 RepID=UPI0013D45E80|nr:MULTISPECIES: tetratricopeptide repeat protein [unclassified Parabacteroides]MDH6533965.1 pilus assembly protein Flp/PilA [Parabacteroides sp. PM5-20]NDV54708.1 hypothetical protein [Parabacteroides sp. 52]
MKKIVLFVSFCFCLGSLFAQDADKLRDEGDAAIKVKNYEEALSKYSEYLKLTDYQDEARIFNAGFSADQAKKYDEAVRFFDMSIKKGYKAENAYAGKAKALRDLNKSEEFSATVEEGLKAFPANANLEKMQYGYFMKLAQAKQKSGDATEAEKLFNEVLKVSNKTYQGNALYSLGILYYNKGAKVLQAATAAAATDPDKYAAEKSKASVDFKKAKEYLEQAKTIGNANAQKSLDAVNEVLK